MLSLLSSLAILSSVLKKEAVSTVDPMPHTSLPSVTPFPKVTCGDLIRCVLHL